MSTGTRLWIGKELDAALEIASDDDWVTVPKFLVFENERKNNGIQFRAGNSPEQEQIGRDTEVVTFCVSFSKRRNVFVYGFSVKAPKDQAWQSYGKAIAKSRLRKILSTSVSFSDLVPLGAYSKGFPPAKKDSEDNDEANEALKEMAKEVHTHFLNRVVSGDLRNKFPDRVRENLLTGCFRLTSPSVF
jgi:hypothetical protein